MQRKTKSFSCLICFFALVFCGILSLPVKAQKLPIALEKGTLLAPTNAEEYKKLAEAYKTVAGRNKQNRNKLMFMAVSQIDLNFRKYQRDRRIGRDLFQIVLDILEIGASTAISITKGERPKALIAEGLTFLQGSRTSVNKNLRLLDLQILFNKMIEKRAVVLTQIIEKSKESDENYPFEQAFVDIVAYYQAGTMDGALSNLAISSGNAAEDAEELLAEAKRNAGIVGALTQREIDDQNLNFVKIQAMLQAFDNAKDPNNPNQLTDKQKEMLKTYRRVYELIQKNEGLRDVSNKLPSLYPKPEDAPTKNRIEKILKDLQENKEVSAKDYDFYLLQIGGAVRGQALNQVFSDILDANKL